MHILLVNDDGFDSPLLHTLCKAAAGYGHKVTVAAPDCQQSAKSHAFTIFDPLQVRQDYMEGAANAYRVLGTPVDSCRLGLMALADSPVDLVISGINNGYNVGLATFVSGTVGAAREAAFQGYPALAVSQAVGCSEETTAYFADVCIRMGHRWAKWDRAPLSFLNVNVPALTPKEIKCLKLCGLSQNVYRDGYEGRISPRGVQYYWLRPEEEGEPTPGSDLDVLRQGMISISMLTPGGTGTGMTAVEFDQMMTK